MMPWSASHASETVSTRRDPLHDGAMARVVFLRGVNVGGQRRLRPLLLARKLKAYDVVNVGAQGTFVVKRAARLAELRSAFRRHLPFEADVMICDGREVLRLVAQDPFRHEAARRDRMRFVSVLARAARVHPALPLSLPAKGPWLVRVQGKEGRFVFGVYRRQMKTIGALGQLDDVFGARATTRSWGTISAIAGIVAGCQPQRTASRVSKGNPRRA
jgi:uncharacterized protein (DUF1697 family)